VLPAVISRPGRYGWLGVEIFFVISGFVIPYSLYKANYELRSFKKFLLKRIVRIDPPYLASIALTLIVAFASSKAPGYRGEPFSVSPLAVLLHLGYINAFFGYPWLNVVYWTLAIEFQYYLSIGLIFPLIASKNRYTRYLTFAALGILAISIRSESFLPCWLFLFLLGIVTFNYVVGLIGKREYLLTVLLFSTAQFAINSWMVAAVGVATALLIAFTRIRARSLAFLGAISYSLYLLHVPIGGRLVNVLSRYSHSIGINIVIFTVTLLACIVVAYTFYRLVEMPSQKFSSRITYKDAVSEGYQATAAEVANG